MHDLLLGLLSLDLLQIVVALLAFARSRRSYRAGAPSHARYAFEHGLLLLSGGAVLLVPIVLGLTDAISESAAAYAAVALEVVAFPAARVVLHRSEAAHLARRPT